MLYTFRIFTGLKNTYDVDLSRLDNVVSRTIKGIIYGESGQRLPDSYDVNVFSASSLNDADSGTKRNLKNQINVLLKEAYFYIGKRSVFSFWHKYTEQDSYTSLWLLVFFEKTSFIATITPKNA